MGGGVEAYDLANVDGDDRGACLGHEWAETGLKPPPGPETCSSDGDAAPGGGPKFWKTRPEKISSLL